MNSSGLMSGSKACSENMNDWQYISLGDLEQNEFFSPKVNLEVLFTLTFNHDHVTCHVTRN